MSEAVTNAVVHAYPDKLGTVQVRVRILPDERLEIAVKDHGMVEYAALREALRQLPERERQVIALRFYHGLTQQRAAGILHISQVQVSRLERRAVERLREWLAT